MTDGRIETEAQYKHDAQVLRKLFDCPIGDEAKKILVKRYYRPDPRGETVYDTYTNIGENNVLKALVEADFLGEKWK